MTKKAPIEKIAGLEERIAEFAANCILICELLPRGRAGSSNFKDQLARSATSVAANYAEASVPSSQRDFAGRLTIALKELAESRMHLSIISRLKYRKSLTKEMMTGLVDEADAIAAILKSAIGTRRAKPKSDKSKSSSPPETSASKKMASVKSSIARLIKDAKAKPRKRPGKKKKRTAAKKTATSAKRRAKTPAAPQQLFPALPRALPPPPQRLLLPLKVSFTPTLTSGSPGGIRA